jgi:hypothetical protein
VSCLTVQCHVSNILLQAGSNKGLRPIPLIGPATLISYLTAEIKSIFFCSRLCTNHWCVAVGGHPRKGVPGLYISSVALNTLHTEDPLLQKTCRREEGDKARSRCNGCSKSCHAGAKSLQVFANTWNQLQGLLSRSGTSRYFHTHTHTRTQHTHTHTHTHTHRERERERERDDLPSHKSHRFNYPCKKGSSCIVQLEKRRHQAT